MLKIINEDFNFDINLFEKYIPQKKRIEHLDIYCKLLDKYNINKAYWRTRRAQSKEIIESIPLQLRSINDIYELNFIGIQFFINLKEKTDISNFKVLIWGCGIPLVDGYLSDLGYNIVSYDNWSQINKEVAEDYLKLINNKNIKLIENYNQIFDFDFDFILDTGNYIDDEKILKNPNLKILFTWSIERLGDKNINYLKKNFVKKNFKTCIVFIKNNYSFLDNI